MLLSATTVLLPVLFVLVIGYWAGRSKKFDADQVNGVNELVLDFALPAIMFVSIVKTTASEAQAESVFLVAMFLGFVGFYLAVLFVSMTFLRHSLGEAALQACSLSFPSVAFMGIPIFKGLFGEGSLLSIASATVLANLTIAPLTVVLLEMHAKRVARESVPGEGAFAVLMGDIRDGLVSSIVKPMVWAPLLAVAIVLLGVTVPKEIDDMLLLIGSTTSGVALFAAGLVTAAHRIHFSREVAGNVIVKMIAQPLVDGRAGDAARGRRAFVARGDPDVCDPDLGLRHLARAALRHLRGRGRLDAGADHARDDRGDADRDRGDGISCFNSTHLVLGGAQRQRENGARVRGPFADPNPGPPRISCGRSRESRRNARAPGTTREINMSAILLNAPASEPVSLAEAKLYLRVEHDDDDDLIAALIAAARVQVEAQTRRALITQTWRLTRDVWPAGGALPILPVPLREVTAIGVYDADGMIHALDVDDFHIDTVSAPAILAFERGAPPAPGQASCRDRDRYRGGLRRCRARMCPNPCGRRSGCWSRIGTRTARIIASSGEVASLPASVSALIAPFRVLSL